MLHSEIFLHDVRLFARHGVMPQERTVGGEFAVSLRVVYDITQAIATDDVAHTLSYAELYDLVVREMAVPSKLLEHVAGRIAHAVLQTWAQADSVSVELTKLNPPMGASCAGAGISLTITRNT
jgi:dihydroneopterin aldolase